MEIPDLNAIRALIGDPQRKLGWLKKSPLHFPVPEKLSGVSERDDPLMAIYKETKRLWCVGEVKWATVLMANRDLSESGTEDMPGELVFSLTASDEQAWNTLPGLVDRLHAFREEDAPIPQSEREQAWSEDINNDFSFHLGYQLPGGWSEDGIGYRATTVMFHRGHLPDGKLSHRILPCLVPPEPPYWVLPVPVEFWPEGFAEQLPPRVIDAPDPAAFAAFFGAQTDGFDRDSMESAYVETFGEIASVFHEVSPRVPHVDVYRFDAREGRDFCTLVTGGMSSVPYPDEENDDDARHELVFYSREFHPPAAEMLKEFSHYPFDTGAAIRSWHTVPLGEHAEAVLGCAGFYNLLAIAGVRKEDLDIGGKFSVGEHPVFPLWLAPLTDAEFDYYTEHGPEIFMKMVGESEHSLLFAPDRVSLV